MFCAECRVAAAIGSGREYALRIARRPLQHLHAAHRAARHREQRVDAEMVEQHRLGAHHVAHGDNRKIEPPWHAGGGIGRGRPGRAHAAADHVGADDEIALGVDRLAGPDHGLPPSGLAGHRMTIHGVLIAGKRVADENGVTALGIERAVCLVGDLEGAKIDSRVQTQWSVGRKTHDRRMRLVRFARAIGKIERCAGLCHGSSRKHFYNNTWQPPARRSNGGK